MNGLCWWLDDAAIAADATAGPGRAAVATTWLSRAQAPAQLDEVPAGVGQVERRAHRRGRAGRSCRAVVADAGAAGDDRAVAEDRVRQVDGEPADGVRDGDLERVRLVIGLDVGRGQAAVVRPGLPATIRWSA